VIPTVARLVSGYDFVVRRFGVAPDVSVPDIQAALDHADELAEVEADEPAALFFAFAKTPKAFPGAWRLMARLISTHHAQKLGRALHADAAAVDALCTKIAHGEATFADVRKWFGCRSWIAVTQPRVAAEVLRRECALGWAEQRA